jgi:hypothetical protein
LKYISPAIALPRLYQIQLEVSQMNIDQKLKELRTNKLKHHLEKRTAAIFCYGMAGLLKKSIYFAPAPAQNLDYDVVARYMDKESKTINYMPIQIKEVVPLRINAKTDLNKEIEKLKKYPVSKDTVVVIQSNRKGVFKIKDVKIPKLNIAGLWILGCCQPDQSTWYIAGDMLTRDAQIYEFPYPTKIITG